MFSKVVTKSNGCNKLYHPEIAKGLVDNVKIIRFPSE